LVSQSRKVDQAASGLRGVDVDASSTTNGAHAPLYDCNGTAAQSWTVAAGDNTIRALGRSALRGGVSYAADGAFMPGASTSSAAG
jgi:hypothetical protein